MYKLEKTPLTISGVLKTAWELYKSSIRYLLLWSFIIALVHITPRLYGIVGYYQVTTDGHYIFSWSAVIMYALLLIVESYAIAVLFYITHLVATEQKVDFPGVFNVAKKELMDIYFASLLYFLIINIGIFLVILPAIFLGVLFSMYLPYVLIEHQSIYYSFNNSAKLVWGHWWQTFFVLVIPFFISYLLRNSIHFTPWTDIVWLLLIEALLLTFFMPYLYSVLLIQFQNLKMIKSLPASLSERPRLQS